ncbi:hypothetical protein F2Q70_00021834 [Brassica cretica]|uniref:Uncharacterized protein n=1 Tax=Brassica cretica TaxID=69181 RepID=A0A8S9GKX4_BRACR|nr:hypothetical protein F2Q70_00021834 [Brassica cretica]
MDNGVENLSRQQHNTLEHQHKVTNEFYNTTGGVDDRFKPKYRQHTRPLIDNDIPTSIHRQPKFGKRAYDRDGIRRFHWEQKDEYEVYRDDHGHARGVDGHIIHVSKDDIKNLLERAPMDEQSYISQEKNEDDFQMKLDGVYYPLKDNISWLTTCMEEMRQDIAIMQTHRAAKATTPASIDIYISPSIGDAPSQSNLTKYKPDSYTRAEVDQMLKEIYRTLGATKDRLGRRFDDIYFPWDITRESSRGINIDQQRHPDIDQRSHTNRPRTASNKGGIIRSDTINHDEEISDDTYTTLVRHQFELECLGDRL